MLRALFNRADGEWLADITEVKKKSVAVQVGEQLRRAQGQCQSAAGALKAKLTAADIAALNKIVDGVVAEATAMSKRG